MAGQYPLDGIAEKLNRIQKRLYGMPYHLDMNSREYYQYYGGPAKIILYESSHGYTDWFNEVRWTIEVTTFTAGRFELLLQELVEFKDGWINRLVGLDTELAIENLQ